MTPSASPAILRHRVATGGVLEVEVSGTWLTGREPPSAWAVEEQLRETPELRRLQFVAGGLEQWDSSLLVCLVRLLKLARQRRLDADTQGLPAGVQGLLRLTFAVPERQGARRVAGQAGSLSRIGTSLIGFWAQVIAYLGFLGQVVIALQRLLRGRARFRGSDLLLFLQNTGVDALPIVTLISVLVGVILAFVGALQLELFGAQIYVANLVALGMTREMGAMMTAIIMAGRSGAAFSAQLGSMQVNEEIDAFTTLGVSPVEFLVLPRLLALTLMMPLLCVYSDLLGILGGMFSSTLLFDISALQYLDQTRSAIQLNDVLVGICKSLLFGLLVALAGCLKGLRCGRSSAAVGQATTGAVVMSIVSIVIADSVVTVVVSVLGI